MPTISVYVASRGWLFDDLLRAFADAPVPAGVRVVTGERPAPGADAWICIRTREAALSPDLSRTVVQVHDLYSRHGEREALVAAGALVLTHPGQLDTLREAGVDPAAGGRPVLLRPIGAQQRFFDAQRQPPGDRPFTVAWLGRPQMWEGVDVKGLDLLAEVGERLAAGPEPTELYLLGANLDRVPGQCWTQRLDRGELPHAAYPDFLASRVDAVVVTSRTEAGPLSLFEALAAGVPVVSTPCGWAPELLWEGESGFVRRDADGFLEALGRIRRERADWRGRSELIRASRPAKWGEPPTQEGWIGECLQAAVLQLLWLGLEKTAAGS